MVALVAQGLSYLVKEDLAVTAGGERLYLSVIHVNLQQAAGSLTSGWKAFNTNQDL